MLCMWDSSLVLFNLCFSEIVDAAQRQKRTVRVTPEFTVEEMILNSEWILTCISSLSATGPSNIFRYNLAEKLYISSFMYVTMVYTFIASWFRICLETILHIYVWWFLILLGNHLLKYPTFLLCNLALL